MTFKIDTGTQSEAPFIQSSSIDETQSLDLSNIDRAERLHRKIIAAIESCETAQELDQYWRSETIVLDAFYLSQSVLFDNIKQAYEDSRIYLTSALGDPRPAEPGNSLGITF